MEKYHFECLTEQGLLFALKVQKANIRHHKGRGPVCKMLENSVGLIGLIDEDPDASHGSYYKKLHKNPTSDKYGLRCCKDAKKKNTLVIMKPRFELWIIDVVETQSKLRMADYGLSNNPEVLHTELINKQMLGKLNALLLGLIKKKIPAILHLKKILEVE